MRNIKVTRHIMSALKLFYNSWNNSKVLRTMSNNNKKNMVTLYFNA